MKKILIIIGILVLSLINLTSCGDEFLNTSPTVDIPIEEYYTSEERLVNSLMAAYQPLQWHDWAMGQYNPLMLLGDVMGEDVFPGGDSPKDNEHWHKMSTFSATADYGPSGLWSVLYSGINRSNLVIENMHTTVGVTEKVRNRVYGEALTLRTYYYHWLWKFWGNVPYYEVNPSAMPYFVDQISADEVYEHLIAGIDIVIKESLLPTTVPIDESGRLTRAAAQMLKANIVMYQKDESRYNEVLADMREIILSGQYTLNPDFKKLWEIEGEWSSESILEVNYTDMGSARSWSNPLGTGGCVTPTLIGINQLKGSSEFKSGWGFGTVNKDLYELYGNGDQRKDGGILSFEKHKESNPNAEYTPRYQDTGFFLRKYLPRIDGNSKATGDTDLNFNNNYRVYRFSETLLIASELIVRTGGDQTEADKFLNTVRARAFKKDISDPTFAPNKQTATLDNILRENRLEFVGEGHRFWDLVRFGKAEAVLGSRGYTPNKIHLPIPRGEMDKAQGTLTQNKY